MNTTRIEDIEYEDIIHVSKKTNATCFVIDGEEVWLDNDEIDIDEDRNIVTVPVWLAKRKGISRLS